MPTIDLSVMPYLEGNFPSYADAVRLPLNVTASPSRVKNIASRYWRL